MEVSLFPRLVAAENGIRLIKRDRRTINKIRRTASIEFIYYSVFRDIPKVDIDFMKH